MDGLVELWKTVIVVGYYTPGPYAIEANRLRESCERFGLPCDLFELFGGISHADWSTSRWREAVRCKPAILEMFLRTHSDRPLLMLDADAILARDPRETLPNTWANGNPPAISMHTFGGRVCSGTIITYPLKAVECAQIAHDWIREDAERPSPRQPQTILRHVKGIDGTLSPEWCWIFDLSPRRHPEYNNPIVTHLQASREYCAERKDKPSLVENRRLKLKAINERKGMGLNG